MASTYFLSVDLDGSLFDFNLFAINIPSLCDYVQNVRQLC